MLAADPLQSAIAAARARIQAQVGWLKASPVPAHLTVLYPFLPPDELDAAVLHALTEECQSHSPFGLVVDRVGCRDGLLSLEPRALPALARLVDGVRGRFPACPPYGGQFGPRPRLHLTVDYGPSLAAVPAELLGSLTADLLESLPVEVPVKSLDLWISDHRRWSRAHRIPLGPGPGSLADAAAPAAAP